MRKRNKQRGGSLPWVVVQYDNRQIPDHYKKLIEINREYCKVHKYEYIFKNEEFDLPPWWIKVKVCLDVLLTNKYNGVIWMDTDASIFDCSQTVDDFTKDPTKHFFISRDPIEWTGIVNAGVWIVKNTPIGQNIMKDWFNLYNKEKWVKTGTSWSINNNLSDIDKRWAGINYEQGSFTEVLLPKYKDSIHIHPVRTLSHWQPTKADLSFIGHFFKGLPNGTLHNTQHYIEAFEKSRIKCSN